MDQEVLGLNPSRVTDCQIFTNGLVPSESVPLSFYSRSKRPLFLPFCKPVFPAPFCYIFRICTEFAHNRARDVYGAVDEIKLTHLYYFPTGKLP